MKGLIYSEPAGERSKGNEPGTNTDIGIWLSHVGAEITRG